MFGRFIQYIYNFCDVLYLLLLSHWIVRVCFIYLFVIPISLFYVLEAYEILYLYMLVPFFNHCFYYPALHRCLYVLFSLFILGVSVEKFYHTTSVFIIAINHCLYYLGLSMINV